MLALASFAHWREWGTEASCCIALALMCSGIVAGQLEAFWFPTNHIASFVSDEGKLASFEIELTDTPKTIPGEGPRHTSGKQIGRAEVREVKTNSGWEKSIGEVSFTFSQTDPPLISGEKLRVLGTLMRPAPAANPGAFDWQIHYRRQRVMAELRVNRACDLQIVRSTSTGTLRSFAAGFHRRIPSTANCWRLCSWASAGRGFKRSSMISTPPARPTCWPAAACASGC